MQMRASDIFDIGLCYVISSLLYVILMHMSMCTVCKISVTWSVFENNYQCTQKALRNRFLFYILIDLSYF